jgi:hypothetical protein
MRGMKAKLFPLLAFLAVATPACGSLLFQLTPAVVTGSPGPNPVIFQGTLTDTDTDGSFLFLNDIGVTFNAPGGSFLSVDPNFFFNSVPGDLIGDGIAADDFYGGPVFEVFIANDTPSGNYFGNIAILGGFNGPGDTAVLATQTFEVVVVTPEPGAALLTLTSLICVAIGRRRMK